MNRVKTYLALLCASLVISTNVHAATISSVVDGGQLIGFNGITVNGQVYNVRFVEGSFHSIFGDASGLDFNVMQDAISASQALMAAYDLFPVFDDESNLTYGVTNVSKGTILTPWKYSDISYPATVGSIAYVNLDSDYLSHYNYDHVSNNLGFIADLDTSSGNNSSTYVWADWQQVTVVPVPATVWLFGSGFVGLIGFARRNR